MSHNAQRRCVLSKGLMVWQEMQTVRQSCVYSQCEVETPTKTHLGVGNRSSCISYSHMYINNKEPHALLSLIYWKKETKFCLHEAVFCHKKLADWELIQSFAVDSSMSSFFEIWLRQGYKKLFCALGTREG